MNSSKVKGIEKIFLENKGYARTGDITGRGFHSSYIYSLEREGIIAKVKRGLYRWEDYDFDEKEELISVSKIVPEGVICLVSALSYYDLSTYNPWEYYVAIRRDARKPALPGYPPIRLMFFSDKHYFEGIREVSISGNIFKIYDIEKTICDCIRYRNKIGMDIVKEALNAYVKRRDKNISKLMKYAKVMRVDSIIREYLEVLL